ncbi:recombinase family protein [Nocardia sp. NPDC056541]|uniref:recombinase family protein n=1 Tax=Nocardia sp. NPDC056541 TaxID=3345860 RepID=UPI00366C39FD
MRKRDIGFRSLHEAIDTTTPGGRLVFHVFAALAEFIRELIVQGTNEGLATTASAANPASTPAAIHRGRCERAVEETFVVSNCAYMAFSVPSVDLGGRVAPVVAGIDSGAASARDKTWVSCVWSHQAVAPRSFGWSEGVLCGGQGCRKRRSLGRRGNPAQWPR